MIIPSRHSDRHLVGHGFEYLRPLLGRDGIDVNLAQSGVAASEVTLVAAGYDHSGVYQT